MPLKRYTDKTGYPTFRNDGSADVWNFFRDGVTSTFLDSFTTCREQTRLEYVEGWSPRSVSWSLEYGSCVHYVFEHAYARVACTGIGTDIAVPDYTTVGFLLGEYRKFWMAEHPDPTTDALAQQEEIYGYTAAVLPSYFRRWSGDFTGKYDEMPNSGTKPVKYESVEGQFKVWYTYPDGLQVPIQGKKDIVFRGKDKKKRVLDTKTMSIINDEDIIDSFEVDFQQNLYLWAEREETKEMPAGSIKNVLRTPGHRQKKEESMKDFLARIAADVAKKEDWDTRLSGGKKITGWFVRYELSLVSSELDEWKKTRLDPLMRDVREWFEGKVAHYPNDKNAIGKYGRCNLFAPMVRKDFSRCYQRSKPFPELV